MRTHHIEEALVVVVFTDWEDLTVELRELLPGGVQHEGAHPGPGLQVVQQRRLPPVEQNCPVDVAQLQKAKHKGWSRHMTKLKKIKSLWNKTYVSEDSVPQKLPR